MAIIEKKEGSYSNEIQETVREKPTGKNINKQRVRSCTNVKWGNQPGPKRNRKMNTTHVRRRGRGARQTQKEVEN